MPAMTIIQARLRVFVQEMIAKNEAIAPNTSRNSRSKTIPSDRIWLNPLTWPFRE